MAVNFNGLQVERRVNKMTSTGRVLSTRTLVTYGDWGHRSKGRNGDVKTWGYSINESFGALGTTISPITSGGCVSHALELNVPVEMWVGHAFEVLLNKVHERGKLPTYMGLDPLLDAFIKEKFKEGAPS